MIGKLNKKAISPLIATVIIIAITVAAGIVLYAMVWPLINKPISQTSCTSVSFEISSDGSCVKPLTGDPVNRVYISIDRTKSAEDELEVTGWKLIVDAGFGERRLYDINLGGNPVNAGEQRTYNQSISAVVGTELGGNVNRISVYPVIKVRNSEVFCEEITQTLDRLRNCV